MEETSLQLAKPASAYRQVRATHVNPEMLVVIEENARFASPPTWSIAQKS
jgi:hypothetical protein